MWNNDEIAKTRAYLQAQEQQKQLEAYNAAKNSYDNTYNNGGLGGFLGSLVSGAAKGIGDIGNGLIDMFGSGIAATKDIFEGGAGSNKNQDAWLKYRRGTDSVKDAKLKTAGTALNAATNLATTAIPGLSGGALTGVGVNALSGALTGVGNELQTQGENATSENALKRAIAGAAGGAAAGAIGSKIGNANSKIGKTLLNNGLAKSAVGRGAIAGAVGGATGAGLSAGLEGQDVAGAALQGGLQGGISGGVTGGITDLARRAVGKGFTTVRDNMWENQKARQAEKIAQQNQAKELANKYTGTSFNEKDLSSKTPAQDAYEEGRGSFSDALNEYLEQGNNQVQTNPEIEALQKRYDTAQADRQFFEQRRNFYENGQEHPISYDTAYAAKEALADLAPAKGGENIMRLANEFDSYMKGEAPIKESTIKLALELVGDAEGVKPQTFESFMSNQPDLYNDEATNAQADYSKALKKEQNLLNQLNDLNNQAQVQPMPTPTTTQEKAPTEVSINDNPEAQIRNNNFAQKLGEEMSQNARETKWQGLYESLDANTARRALSTNAPQTLSNMGVQPENYNEYAKTSNYVNEQVSKIAKDSGVMIQDPELVSKLSLDNSDVLMSDTAAKKYNNYIKQIVADGKNPTEYSASYILEKSRELGNKAANLRGNTDDVKALRSALTDAKWILRNEATQALEQAGATGDLTTDLLAKGLTKLGANQKVVDYYSAPNEEGNAPNVSDYIKRSSLFEQARDMGNQMSAEQYTRNASKGKASITNQLMQWTGVDKPIKTVGKNLVAPISAGVQSVVGTGLTKLGNFVASTPSATPLQQSVINNYIGRTAATELGGNITTDAEQARDYNNLSQMLGSLYSTETPMATSNPNLASIDTINASGNSNGINYTPGYQTANTSGMNNTLATLSRAMELALASGDVDSYQKIASLYTTAAKIYELQNPTTSTSSELTASQKNQLAKLQIASNNIDRLEALYNQAGGGQGFLGGNIANFLGGIGLNSDVATYNQLSQGLINDINSAIGSGSLNTDAKVQRALGLVPQITDDARTAKNKLAELRALLQENASIYNQVYSM